MAFNSSVSSYEDHGEIRAAAILTTSYVAATVIGASDSSISGTTSVGVREHNYLLLDVDFTIGSLTDLRIKVEGADTENGTYRQLTTLTTSGAVSTVNADELKYTATGNYATIITIAHPFIRVSAKGTGTVTSSSLTINARTGLK